MQKIGRKRIPINSEIKIQKVTVVGNLTLYDTRTAYVSVSLTAHSWTLRCYRVAAVSVRLKQPVSGVCSALESPVQTK